MKPKMLMCFLLKSWLSIIDRADNMKLMSIILLLNINLRAQEFYSQYDLIIGYYFHTKSMVASQIQQ